MRLIDTETGKFTEFFDLSTVPPYAILSHTWERTGEQTYQDVVKIQEKCGLGSRQSPPGPPPSATDPNLKNASSVDKASVTENHHSAALARARRWISSIRIPYFRKYSIQAPDSVPPTNPQATPSIRDLDTELSTSPIGSIWDADSGLSMKVRKACEIAHREGYRWIWIDSSCIDKTSSSELSEAINSMFKWYSSAQVCYAFLADVPSPQPECDRDLEAKDSTFRKSRWFTRSWTLQELLAPDEVVFFSQEWEGLGTKDTLATLIQDITFIDRRILKRQEELTTVSVAERMRWAARRQATRVEDEAYSLLGIFNITMPTLYGEGKYAFRRLQQEILQRIPDQSLFAWGSVSRAVPQEPTAIGVGVEDFQPESLFAPDPRSFDLHSQCTILAVPGGYTLDIPTPEYTPTPYGIRTRFCFLPLTALNPGLSVNRGLPNSSADVGEWYLVVLGCEDENNTGSLLGRLCYTTPANSRIPMDQSGVEFLHVPSWVSDLPGEPEPHSRHNAILFSVPVDDTTYEARVSKTVYLPHPTPALSTVERRLRLSEGDRTALKMTLSPWAQSNIRRRGHNVLDIQQPKPTVHNPNFSHSFTLIHHSWMIHAHVQHRYMLFHHPRHSGVSAVVIEGRIWVLPMDSSYVRDSAKSENARRDTIRSTSPYTSIIWVDATPWAMSLPAKCVNVVSSHWPGNYVSLRFALGLTARSHYNIQVESSNGAGENHRNYEALPRVVDQPHTEFKLTMLGLVREPLEAKAYTVRLEGPDANSVDSVLPYSLIISNAASGFTIFIKYFHVLRACKGMNDSTQELVVAARVTVTLEESLFVSSTAGPATSLLDGPYVALWRDSMNPTWRWSLEEVQFDLTTPTGNSMVLCLGLDLAWQSEYYLRAIVQHDPGRVSSPSPNIPHDSDTLDGTHENIFWTLPGHIKRTLQERGYEVHFEASNDDRPDHCRLTLSNAGFLVDIDYSHTLSTNSYGKQRLTLRACVNGSSGTLQGTSGAVAQDDGGQVVEWDAWHPEAGAWRRQLPTQDIALTLARGTRVTLRLGFYLVWFSEYCLTVQVVPSGNVISRVTA